MMIKYCKDDDAMTHGHFRFHDHIDGQRDPDYLRLSQTRLL